MNKYIKDKQHGFLGEGTDAANHSFCAFKIKEEIHIVYHIDTQKEYSIKESLITLHKHPENYLWTPYAHFI